MLPSQKKALMKFRMQQQKSVFSGHLDGEGKSQDGDFLFRPLTSSSSISHSFALQPVEQSRHNLGQNSYAKKFDKRRNEHYEPLKKLDPSQQTSPKEQTLDLSQDPDIV
jgi:hypothetical protein